MTSQAITAPNVFIQYECGRNEISSTEITANIYETYEKHNEDVIVDALLCSALSQTGRTMSSVFYLEIGVNHPIQSSTYLFYRRHEASGVLVGTSRLLIDNLRRIRPRDTVLEFTILAQPTVSYAESFDAHSPDSEGAIPNIHINAFLETYATRSIDFLSIAVEGRNAEILEALDFIRFRPLAIQCELSEHLHPGLAARMTALLQAKGYTLAARTDCNLIFTDNATAGTIDSRPRVNSFDVFDTLIARRCIEPTLIFQQVEAETQVPDFASHRRAAETALLSGPYTLDDVYARLSQVLGLDEAATAALKTAEITAELNAVIPIAENITCVQDGDLLLSDMYLSEDMIRQLLAKAGLDKKVGLVVTTGGKYWGTLWPEVLSRFSINQHMGDNQHSDVAMPTKFGINCAHTTVSSPSHVEKWLLDLGLHDLARLLREARLRTWHPDPITRQLQLIQTQLNFPILVLSSLRLLRLARNVDASHLLFVSRDCNMWLPLYQALAKQVGDNTCPAEYFYTSRQTQTRPSSNFLTYARNRLGERGLVVDICGSGWSMAHLLQSLELNDRHLFFIQRLATVHNYQLKKPMPQNCTIHTIFDAEKRQFNNMFLEMCNYAEHGLVCDIQYIRDTALPVFKSDNRSVAALNMVKEQRRCFTSIINLMAEAPLNKTLTLRDDVISEIIANLYGALSEQKILSSVYGEAHTEENFKVGKLMEWY